MDIISHVNALPWQVGSSFFLRLFDQALVAVVQLAIGGLAYAGLHWLLSNRIQNTLPESDKSNAESPQGRGRKFLLKTYYQEDIHDET
ncbi:MAG: hypothetical protein PVI92_03890 [Chromatiales bacterium]|jgi:hypothetical protein